MDSKKGLEALQRTLLIMNYDNNKTLSENTQIIFEQTAPFYAQERDYSGKVRNPKSDYIYNQGGPMAKPQGAIDAKTLFPNGNYPKTVTADQAMKLLANPSGSPFSQPSIGPEVSKTIQKYSPNYWKGKPEPSKPTKYEGQILSSPGTKLPKQPWGYYEGKLGNYDEQMKQYETDFDMWQEINDPEGKINRTRVTKTGKKVPEGFWPSEYDKYLEDISECQRVISDIEKKYRKTRGSKAGPIDAGFDESRMTQGERNKYKMCQESIKRKKEEYYHAEFLQGISKEMFEQYNAYSKALNDYWSKKVSECYANAKNQNPWNDPDAIAAGSKNYGDIRTYFQNQLPTVGKHCGQLTAQWSNQMTEMKKVFGMDMRSNFDKIWDDWGTWIQIGGSLLTLLTGPYAPFLDAAFNTAIAAYQLDRGQYSDAGVSLLFAVLPGIGNALKIGEIPADVAKSISQKVAKSGVKNSSDLANLIISLPKNEQQWFKQFTKVSPESFKKATVETVERYAQRTGKSITPELEQQIAQKFGGKSLKQAVKTGGKIAFKWPAARRLTFDTSVLLSASLFAHKVEEYYKQSNAENLSQENIKNAEKFFNAIPQEVRDKVLDSISVNTLNNVLGGDFKKAADEIKQDKKKKLTPAQQKKLDDELSALF